MPSDNGKDQIQPDKEEVPESAIKDTNILELKHTESRLLRFLDTALPVEAALNLAAEAFHQDHEGVAADMDALVSRGLLVVADGNIGPAPLKPSTNTDTHLIQDEHNTDRYDQSNPQATLDVTSEEEDDTQSDLGKPINEIYQSWLEIVHRHPEWSAKLKPGVEDVNITLNDPSGTMDELADVFEYDAASVAEKDQLEFQRFLILDKVIEDYEAKHGRRSQGQVLRAHALYRLLGGKIRGIGLIRSAGVYRLTATAEGLPKPNRADLVRAIAEATARREFNCGLYELPQDEQMMLLMRAESESLRKHPVFVTADIDPAEVPKPDPTLAPAGFEAVIGPDGKKNWRSKTDPNVKVERPGEVA